jgi:hypothetical protein
MKGQIFIIASVLVLVALLLTRLSTKTSYADEEELFYESFSNLKAELIKTVDLSLINQEPVSDNLYNFTEFSKEVFKKKGYAEDVKYSITLGPQTIVYLNVSLSSKNYYLLESLIINRTVYA